MIDFMTFYDENLFDISMLVTCMLCSVQLLHIGMIFNLDDFYPWNAMVYNFSFAFVI